MTPKERMLTAIAHAEPDRVPVGEWQFGPEIATPVLGDECTWLGGMSRAKALWEGRRDQVINEWKTGLVRLAEHYQWDAVLLHAVIGSDTAVDVPEPTGGGTWKTATGDVITYSEETDRLFVTEKGNAPPTADIPAPVDDTPTASELELIRHVVSVLGDTHFLFSAALRGHPQFRYSNAAVSEVEQWVSLYQDPDAFLEARMRHVRTPEADRAVQRVKLEGLDGVAYGWDFGCTTGPFMSPEMFRRGVQPVLAAWADLAHRHGLVMLLHACGNNQPLMDMIVEAGVDVYQSIQTEMDIVEMKTRYGQNITLWGGMPAGDLVLGKPDAIRREGARYLQACKPGGGYIYGTTHSVMPGAQLENYRAMLAALQDAGRYGGRAACP
ncbi:MAG: hypothetical protein HN742_19410 [Lentisphaerae bacterium]|jgi:uroporphyrinogen decarboxylase|nr:hypothetical protein [Lentisphaerota bacterium]MBT4821757.1 hypothetical protein [Lentisphaerota bacterium]MBT5611818.1 hypothetical protein [Lentisphaerota bacterium]MBT7053497.1 hypothetical protein [Lentisphaerota bacterium]MBT7844057.1 hypothetical protein [Lentisphaerota bacterium]